MFEIDLISFKGPLDLLLKLIKKNKIQIEDIPIVEITESYTKIIKYDNSIAIEDMGDFILLASELVHIKSHMLLPVEEFEDEVDPRENLILRLKEYELFSSLAEELANIGQDGSKLLTKLPSDTFFYKKEKIEIMEDIDLLIDAWQNLLDKEKNQLYSEDRIENILSREEFIIEDIIDNIKENLCEKPISMKSLIKTNLIQEWIAVFIAILEMLKLNKLRVYLENEEIYLRSVSN